ncbi:transmembrane channel-like protein 7 [Cylas formicarius]|uniref:transmembrane channel-like protein 7 n=1 Tax=Cylas formicarius TaxID=197179 RepID=UPI002958785A|nr:transmembrane channel-like protein 7 [Cylas formicarius]XP_060519240.1 transmembrane channel-like protein 7 [Cylas formicarius]XP_060519241.1 transmembrane channel-like protein 7 [Cylas formicarius]
MSGGERKKKNTRSQGWEEAGSEFYQESYPGDAEIEVLCKDPKRLATLLPSKQTRAIAATLRLRTNDTRTNKSTLRRYPTSRSRRDSTAHRRPSLAGEVQVSMLPDLSEMKSDEQTAWEEIMKLKGLPLHMSEKREQKSKIMSEPNLLLQGFEQFKWRRRKAWHQFSVQMKEVYHKVQLWRKDINLIEGNFGTGVVVFFHFLKWLFCLNLFIFLLVVLFVTLPTVILDDDKNQVCHSNSTSNSSCFYDYYCSVRESNLILELIQGTGRLEKTILFYGFYAKETFPYHVGGTLLYYDLPLAYILVAIVYFLISLAAIIKTGAKRFKERLVEGEGQFYQYSNLLFGGWDFCIHNAKSARIKHKAIYSEIRALLETEKLEEERQSRSRNERYRIFFCRCLVNSTVLAVLLVCGAAIYFIFDWSNTQLASLVDFSTTEQKLLQLFYEFLPSMTIVSMNMVIPYVFTFLVSYENYSPLFVIRLTLIRTVLLRLASLMVLYASLYNKISCDVNIAETECVASECGTPTCWETYVGQQIYKLLLTDFATHLVMTFVVNFGRAFLARHLDNKFFRFVGEQSFDLPRHVLDVVYTQTLCWVGIYFAPLLSALATILFFLLFYIKKFACMVNCKPSMVVYRASRSYSMFMIVLLVSYVVALVPIAFVVSELTPSRSCGPFRSLPSVWNLIEETFGKTPIWVQGVAAFIPTAGFAIPLFIVLILSLYYYTAVNSANRHMVTVLKNQLVLEGHDKQFLINRLYMFIKQENDKHQKMGVRVREGDRHASN